MRFLLQKIKASGLKPDIAFTSVLKRAIKTLFYIQEGTDLHWIPVIRDWRLNERMYGSLQGLNKAETAAKHGEEQVLVDSGCKQGVVYGCSIWKTIWSANVPMCVSPENCLEKYILIGM